MPLSVKFRLLSALLVPAAFFPMFPAGAADVTEEIIDMEPPVIEFADAALTATEGQRTRINLTISDTQSGVREVFLYFRLKGEVQYLKVPMRRKAKPRTAFYLDIAPYQVRAPAIEYYVEAIDNADNRVLRGAASAPLALAVIPKAADADTQAQTPAAPATETAAPPPQAAEVPAESAAPATEASAPATLPELGTDENTQAETTTAGNSNRKWWYVAGGVLLTGALYASQQSSDKSNSNGNGGSSGDTGSVVVTGPKDPTP